MRSAACAGNPCTSTVPLSINSDFAPRKLAATPFDLKVFSAVSSGFTLVSVPLIDPPSGSVAVGNFFGAAARISASTPRSGSRANGGPPSGPSTKDKPKPPSAENTDDAGIGAAVGAGCAHATPTNTTPTSGNP